VRCLSFALLSLVLVSSLQSTTIYVPDNYPTIQGAINASTHGDIIVVRPGTYFEHDISFLGKAITVMGTAPEDSVVVANTIVEGNTTYRTVFIFQSGEDSTSVLSGLTITNAYDGSGVVTDYSSPKVINCVFSANTWSGMQNSNSSPTVINCIFSGNSGSSGGGMLNSYSSPTVINCTFHENGGGMANWVESNPTVINCTFSRNYTGNSGGGMTNVLDCNPTVINSRFIENTAGNGGGVHSMGSGVMLINCTFNGNTATHGGGMYTNYSDATIINCTFNGNTAVRGGGMYNDDSNPTVTNSILWDNGGAIYNTGGSAPIVNYSNVEGGYAGEGNIDTDPLFVDLDYGDFHLSSNSPCIDSGTDAGVYDDFEEDIRPAGYGFDMGVDESPYSVALNLALTPGSSQTVPPGGALDFRTLIQNNTDNGVVGDYWLSVLLPNSNEIVVPESFVNYANPLNGQVPANLLLELFNEADIPWNAPVGSYEMIGRVGVYPNTIIDEESFQFQVIE